MEGSYRIAATTFRITMTGGGAAPAGLLAPFAIARPSGRPDVLVDLRFDPGFRDGGGRSRGKSIGSAGGDVLSFRHASFAGRLAAPGGVARAAFRLAPDAHALANVVRIVLAASLPVRGGILLHAAAAAWDGGALLLAGVSGAGKSTLSRLLRRGAEVTPINEDTVALRAERRRGLTVQTFPFLRSNVSADPHATFPLAHVLLLRGKGENRLERLDPVRALPLFMRHVLQFAPAAATAGLILDLALRTVTRVPCWSLSFRKDDSAVGFLARELGLPLCSLSE